MAKRAFIIVLDSFGIGKAPDAAAFGDEGSDTLASISKSAKFSTPVLGSLGMAVTPLHRPLTIRVNVCRC